MASGPSRPSNLHRGRPFSRIIFPAANSGDSIPFAAYPLFGNLTEWDCTNEDHRPVICLRVDRMRWRPAESRSEANRCRPERPAHGRYVRRYGDGGHRDLSRGRGLARPWSYRRSSSGCGRHDDGISPGSTVPDDLRKSATTSPRPARASASCRPRSLSDLRGAPLARWSC
jgi:hypothetical protein